MQLFRRTKLREADYLREFTSKPEGVVIGPAQKPDNTTRTTTTTTATAGGAKES